MKILAPIDHFDEAEPLIHAGADELYGGFVSSEWKKKYSLGGSINKRTFAEAQFASFAELKKTVSFAHDNGVQFFMTLNNDYYSEAQYPLVLKEIERAVRLEVDALLVADLGLILECKKQGYPIDLHLSILATVLNTEAARFYQELGVSRIVLDRTLTLTEIEKIVSKVKDVEFEVFMMYGKCPNIEGLCTLFHHDDPKHIWPCSCHYSIKSLATDEANASVESAGEAQSQWSHTERGSACGLCAMFDLDQAGIYSLKIAGRGRYTEDKIRAIELVENSRQMLMSGVGRQEFYQSSINLFNETYGKSCTPYVCYFPDLRQELVNKELDK